MSPNILALVQRGAYTVTVSFQVFSALRETLDSEAQIQISGIIGSVL